MSRLEQFTAAYIACALWCGVFDPAKEGEPDPNNYTLTQSDLSDTTLRVMTEDCKRFWEEIETLLPLSNSIAQIAGNDFWLSRNGHGSGFFDSGDVYGNDIADNLSVLAHNFRTITADGMPPKRWGDFELYIGDDGLIYHV